MKTYELTIIAAGLDPESEDFADRFFEAGSDDATVSFQKGTIIVDFTRKALTLGHAIRSAVTNVESAGAEVMRLSSKLAH